MKEHETRIEIEQWKNGWNLTGLDQKDTLHHIAQKYSPETFSHLSFDEMLEAFTLEGTSSPALFDIFLQAAEREYQKHADREEYAFFIAMEQRLHEKAFEIQQKGFPGEEIVGARPFERYYAPACFPLAAIENASNPDYAARIWTITLGKILLVQGWKSMKENGEAKSIEEMYNCLFGVDRQFGYFGRRASVVINALMQAKRKEGDEIGRTREDLARRTLAILHMLKRICKQTTARDEFWPYLVDSKGFSFEK